MNRARLQLKPTTPTHATQEMVRTHETTPQRTRPGDGYTGNQAVLRRLSCTAPHIQCKLEIGAVNDPLEAEAEQVAEQVMRMPTPDVSLAASPTQLSRKCAACQEEDQKVRTRRAEVAPVGINAEAPDSVHEVLRTSGRPLDSQALAFFEPRFGHDFGAVRLHDDAQAASSARDVGALGYTVGRHVVLDSARYQPTSVEGRRLLAHELTHTIQQGAFQSPGVTEPPSYRAAINGGLIQRDKDDKVAEKPKSQKSNEKKPKKPTCTRTIFAEGTCADLVAGSRFICCDPDNGLPRAGKKKDIDGTDCPDGKFTPIFTCDNKCKTALKNGCDDNDNWMAVPNNQFTTSQCGDIWTICANGKQTTGRVRDHSVTETRFEVSPRIQKDLGVTVGDSFEGAVYRPGAAAAKIDQDSCCNSPDTGASKSALDPDSASEEAVA